MNKYLIDKRITDAPELMSAIEPIREVHAMRLMVQDELKGKSVSEVNHMAESTLSKHGIKLCYDLAGQGKFQV
jgi:hypothetical protein